MLPAPCSMFYEHGSTLIDAIVGAALMVVIFMGLFGVIQLAIQTVGSGKARTGATALAQEQIEYVRSLPYSSVAVVGGIPAGFIPAEEVIVLNNITYTRRTFVQFVDDDADGVGVSDVNGIQADYKVAKVSVSWDLRGLEHDVSLVTNVVPKGIETLDGGGTLALNITDAAGAPVDNAGIIITNSAVNPSISIGTFSNIDGVAYFPGAPASAAYEIVVTKDGYSTDQTYAASGANPNPNPGTLTVIEDTITSSTFSIDRVSDLTIRSFDEVRSATWTDMFTDASLIESFSGTQVSGGAVVLAGAPGSYTVSGMVMAIDIEPEYLHEWTEVLFDTTTNASTTASVQVYYTTATSSALVPDAVLAGNAGGFTSSPIDISTIPADEYPSLALAGTLETIDVLNTPSINEWSVVYVEGPVPRPDTSFTIRGTKTIGTDGGGAPIYKFTNSFATDALGEFVLEDMEWDAYFVEKGSAESGLSIVEICPFMPLGLDPNVEQTLDVIFTPASTHSLLVYVTNDQGQPLEDASVTVTRTGYNETIETSACGQSYFRDLGSLSYDLSVSATGYTTQNITGIGVSGATTYSVLLNP